MNVLIVGAGGQLGAACRVYWPESSAYRHEELDISDAHSVRAVVAEEKPMVIINAGAYTDVEQAEIDHIDTYRANAIGPLVLAQAATSCNAALVHVSTDYVFDGMSDGFDESDTPHPINTYGISKYAGEMLVQSYCTKYYIVRTSALFGPRDGDVGDNFVTKRLIQIKKGKPISMVSDQWTVPTYTNDLVTCIDALLAKKAPYGIYHGVNSGGGATWLEFTQAIADALDVKASITPISTSESGTSVIRPKKSVLRDNKLQALGIAMPDWRDALARYVQLIT